MFSGLIAIDQMGLELPVIGHGRELFDAGLDGRNGVEMLQVGAQAFELEGSPHENLVHAVGDVGPFGKHVCRGLVRFPGLFVGGFAVEEENLWWVSVDCIVHAWLE